MRSLSHIFLVVILSSLFMGCAVSPQLNVNATDAFWQNTDAKIGVYVSPIPEVKGHLSGAGCLLCLATASAINGPIDKHMKTQSSEDLATIKAELLAKLNEKNVNVVSIDDVIVVKDLKANSQKGPNIARKNFSGLGKKYDVDYLLFVNIDMIGTMRNFANYVPVGNPSAIFRGSMYIVDTNTNTYEFYESINLSKFSESEWKEPPSYPGLTNAYYTVLEMAKSAILDLKATVIKTAVEEPAEEVTQSLSEPVNNGEESS